MIDEPLRPGQTDTTFRPLLVVEYLGIDWSFQELITAFRLAGLFAAHAVWCVSDGDRLIPMLAYTLADDERKMERFAFDDLAVAIAQGKQKLKSNEMDADDAVLLYDGRIDFGNEKIDAIIIEIRAYFSPDSEAIIAVPYAPNTSGVFRVHGPKLIEWKNCDDFDTDAAFESFFTGVGGHEEGSKIWNECLDESN